MELLISLRNQLREPRLKNIDYDSDELIAVHKKILGEKKMMRSVFLDFYELCRRIDARGYPGKGLRVELGAGSSLFKQFYPDIITTDIKKAPHLDMAVDAQNMPFEPASVWSIYCINCFHHLPDPAQFLKECKRVLLPGGKCILIEPYYGPLASLFYKKVFDTECFIKEQVKWGNSEQGYMQGANQALSYIVFKRDRKMFDELFPELKITQMRPLLNYPRYFLSGGLNFRQLLPDFTIPLIRALEWLMLPLAPLLALHYVVVIEKKGKYQ